MPTGAIAPGQKLTYTIDYAAVNYPNSDFALTNVVITNAVPVNVVLITDSIRSDATASVTYTVDESGAARVITWKLDAPVPDGAAGNVAYTVQRPPLPSAPANGLHITKAGTVAIRPKELIRYQLVTTNITTTVAANLVITDRLPAGAQYVLSSDDGVVEDGIVRWTHESLEPGERMTVTLIVRAEATITNDAYGVQAADNLFAQGDVAVVTVVNESGVLPPPTPEAITNHGAWIFWQYTDVAGQTQLGERFSLPLYNPLVELFLPLIGR